MMISMINMVYGPGFTLTLYLLWFLIFVVCIIVCMEREREGPGMVATTPMMGGA